MTESVVLQGTYTSHTYIVLKLPFSEFPLTTMPGNYGFFMRTNGLLGSAYRVLYLGIADDLRSRLSSHERMLDAIRLGANVIAAHINENNNARCAEEADLIARYNPPMNVQHRTLPLSGLGNALFETRRFT